MTKTGTYGLIGLLAMFASACGKDDCEKAVDTVIKCESNEKAQAEMKKARSLMVSACKSAKNDRKKKRIACGKKDSCEEYEACKLGVRAEDDIKEINEKFAAGEFADAIRQCTYKLDAYAKVPAFKEACDKAINEGFDKVKKVSSMRFKCADEKVVAALPPLKAKCEGLAGKLTKDITAVRDSGEKLDRQMCYNLKGLLKGNEAELAKAEVLCEEAKMAETATKAVAEAKENLEEKSKSIPYECGSFMKAKSKLGESEWYAAKVKEVAKVCYGDLGKLVLTDVAYCGMNQKKVHEFAAEYKLGEQDPELAKLLESTAEKCGK